MELETNFLFNNSRGLFSSFSSKPSGGHPIIKILHFKELWISAIIR